MIASGVSVRHSVSGPDVAFLSLARLLAGGFAADC